jgi:hypothetical protein
VSIRPSAKITTSWAFSLAAGRSESSCAGRAGAGGWLAQAASSSETVQAINRWTRMVHSINCSFGDFGGNVMHLADPRLLRTLCYLDGRWLAADDGAALP